MKNLKRVLTVMVVTLVLIIVVGGLYVFSMGNMNHGKTDQTNISASQNDSQDESKQNKSTGDNSVVKESPAGTPVIIQAPQAAPKVDPRLYVEQLKEKIKEINDANSQIASSAGGTMVMQPNGSSDSSGQSNINMNELHQSFYKLGQNVSSMEQTLDNLAKTVQESNVGPPYYGIPPAYSYPQNLAPQPPDQMGSMNSNMQMNQNLPMSHFNLSSLLNVNTINLVFSLILIVSIILGITAVIGFISSLFKPQKASREGTSIQ